ncbi:acyltransferase family protein [Novosphingobium colocasiae]|uniref:Acyltransferase n=1 Tax=Novosphingobium colocasiae TaxID=1256513 RepID=A0A918PFU4_9SPHN|nr:acyltransferase [Novosphingobium colocasiae]GGZ06221.1 acyltransferase [Novosphingobium colocasiae]
MSGAFSRLGDNPAQPVRLHRLDGLRGLAACGVAFLYHPQSLFAPAAMVALPQPFAWFRDWGWTMVDLFFLISGYIFAHVYLAAGALEKGHLREFAVARLARLYPLHLLTLCLCALLFAADPANTPLAFVANLAMLQGFYPPEAQAFNGPSWSISVECVCYLLFAMAAVGGLRRVRLVAGLAIAGALVHFILQGRAGGPWTSDDLSRGLLGFFLGQAMWLARGRLARIPVPVLAALMIGGLMIDMGQRSSLLPLCLIAWPAALLLALRSRFAGSAPMRWLGDRSYAIYLLHMPVLKLIEMNVGKVSGGPGTAALWTAGFAALVLVLADLSFRLVEVPARRAIRAVWAARRDRAVAAA